METIKVPINAIWDVDLKKKVLERIYYAVPGLADVVFQSEGLTLKVTEAAQVDLAGVGIYVQDLIKNTKKVKPKVLEQATVDPTFVENPFEALKAQYEVFETHDGSFVLSGNFLRRMTIIDTLIRQHAATIGADEMAVPTLLATKSLVANGYLHDFPHHALFAAPVKHDLRALQAVADIRQVSSEDFYQFNDYLGAPDQILAPTVCYHCFEAFRDRQFDKPEVLITALGQCHRFESKNLKDLRRLKHFRMRELVYFGDEASVQRRLNASVDWILEIMRNWNVQFRLVTANDPFFLAESDRKSAYQTAFHLKRELQLYLPFADQWLAVGSFNHHQSVLAEKYGFKLQNVEKSQSGCIGFGFERFTYALYCQFGFLPTAWPVALK
ncbi:MAG: hypothetical protein CMM62_03580 [Rhodospirillaceae bacterium]|mgnify:CR=1 FL=1|nr:hypothetical protein [Rhodospirillaceae bacterium]MAX62479.1 hypothetical protein [Rhodospirillaceae bacterium]MBB56877.1 hypothetical protein [Rhodospirillaceae bacterium]|tara:strand:+ start:58942 stop:60090 length:1149 start_codon:yes stop_codon:yes gene_type:complete